MYVRALNWLFMSQILCTLDFSDSSQNALRLGIMLAKQLNAHLTLLYTFRLIKMPLNEAVVFKKKMEQEANNNFSLVEKDYLKDSGLTYDFKSEVGFMVHRVEDLILKQHIDFLIIDKKLPGNNEALDELISKVNVPIVLVP
jgi:hypothetical protein